MKFTLGVVAGVFLTLTVYRIPHYIRFDDQPGTPLDWTPKVHIYKNGKRLVEDA